MSNQPALRVGRAPGLRSPQASKTGAIELRRYNMLHKHFYKARIEQKQHKYSKVKITRRRSG